MFVVTSSSLALVPGVVKNNVRAEPAVSARLDNIEKMMEDLSKGLTEIKNSKQVEWPAIQLNGKPVTSSRR